MRTPKWVGLVFLVLGLIAVTTYNEARQRHQIERQATRIKELEDKWHADTANPTLQNGSLNNQIVCAEQAKRTFESNQRSDNQTRIFETHFVSRYQPVGNRCFVEIERSAIGQNRELTIQRYVSDAISGELLGMYIQSAKEAKPGWCDMIDRDGQTRYCESSDEFTELAEHYMK